MKIRPLFASVTLTFAALVTGAVAVPMGAGAASTVQLRFANSAAYSLPTGNSYGFCVDGTFIGNVATGALSDAVSVTPGDHDIVILDDASGDCVDGSQEVARTFSVPDVASATIILNNRNADEGVLQLLQDDLSCPAAGQGRLVVRNGSPLGSETDPAVDFFAATGGADPALVLGDVPLAGQASTDLAPGAYMKARAGVPGDSYNDATEVPPGTFDIQAGKVTIVFLAGGWDGFVGLYSETLDANCVTTPTLAPTTTSVPPKTAPVAVPVATQPTYTG